MLQSLLDLIAPRFCVVCGNRLSAVERQHVCLTCQMTLPRTNFHLNALDNPMARLFWHRLPMEKASALFYYETKSEPSRIIESIKYRDNEELAVEMGRLMATEWQRNGFFDGMDVIIPVPLHRKRHKERGYNQSEAIARGIAEITGLPVRTDAIVRTASTPSQTRLNTHERVDNVEDAFCAASTDGLAGKHILIIDDVVTTGSTAHAAASRLKSLPDIRISVASIGFTRR